MSREMTKFVNDTVAAASRFINLPDAPRVRRASVASDPEVEFRILDRDYPAPILRDRLASLDALSAKALPNEVGQPLSSYLRIDLLLFAVQRLKTV